MNAAIEEFAERLMRRVRDYSVQSATGDLSATANSPVARRLRDVAAKGDCIELVRVAIPDIVDVVVFYILAAIDQDTIRLSYRASDGSLVDLTEQGDGELGGLFMERGGWREKYSKERFFDDLADLGRPWEKGE